jgi:hypothetical protein
MLWRLGIKSHIGCRRNCYELKVLQSESLMMLIDHLDRRKHPERFREASEFILGRLRRKRHYHKKSQGGDWVPINRIRRAGRATVIGWNTEPSHQIVLASGIRTHNSGKTQLVTQRSLYEAENKLVPGRQVYMNYPIEMNRLRNGFRVVDQDGKLTAQYPGQPQTAERIHYVEDVYGFLSKRRAELQEHPLRAEDEGRDVLALDEAWEYAGSRRSLAKRNVEFTDMLKIGRKLGFEIIASMQLKSSVDKVMRTLATKNILAERHYYIDMDDKQLKSWYEYTMWWAGGDTYWWWDAEFTKFIHYYYLSTALQAPGATSMEAMAENQEETAAQDEMDLMKNIAATLKDWDNRFAKNPFVNMKPAQAKRFYERLFRLLEGEQEARALRRKAPSSPSRPGPSSGHESSRDGPPSSA